MTDNTQELDEILQPIRNYADIVEIDVARQAVLDWHNKQIEAVLNRIADAWSSSERLKHTNVTIGEEVFIDAIEAERKKLKED